MHTPWHQRTLSQLSHDLACGHVSSATLTTHFLERIARHDPALNAFVTVCADQALQDAQQADIRRAQGHATPLTGLPIAHKDIFCTRGLRTTCASRMLERFVPPYHATLVSRLHEQAGMVMLGKLNMDEFAMGSSNENSFFGPVRNPWDRTRVPGGSSGGSAAAVAARLVPASTGTDTGGSIRQPASLTGITGLKPTYGRISRYGMVAYASSLDHAGPMTQSAEDAALLMQAMSGLDPLDSTSLDEPVPDFMSHIQQSIAGMRIGVIRDHLDNEAVDPAVRQRIQQAMEVLGDLGVVFEDVTLPESDLAMSAYYILASAECASNLARYDGVRYGHRVPDPSDVHDLYARTRAEGFGPEVVRRILVGTYVLSAEFRHAYYVRAQQERQRIADAFQRAFASCDAVLNPTTPQVAFKLGEKTDDPVSMYLCDLMTIPANLAGMPSLSMPVGFASGTPVGMQLTAPHLAEHTLLQIAHQYQLRTSWHRAMPEAFDDPSRGDA